MHYNHINLAFTGMAVYLQISAMFKVRENVTSLVTETLSVISNSDVFWSPTLSPHLLPPVLFPAIRFWLTGKEFSNATWMLCHCLKVVQMHTQNKPVSHIAVIKYNNLLYYMGCFMKSVLKFRI
jgi:hypothetical protein